MLLSFSVANFRSFAAEQTLNLLASKRLGAMHDSPHCSEVPGTDEHALRVAALYGANGAGKSNLVRALRLVQRLVLSGASPAKPLPYTPFLLDAENPTKPTSFELQFLQEGEVFRYGLCYDANRVHEEWLDVYEGTRERNVFTRANSDDGSVTVSLGLAANGEGRHQKIKALAEVGARPNQPFLSEVVNLDDREAQGPRFRRAIEWFKSTLAIVEAATPPRFLGETIAAEEGFVQFAGEVLREAQTGIADLDVQTEELPTSKMPMLIVEAVAQALRGEPFTFPGLCGDEVLVNRSAEGAVNIRRVLALHDLAGSRSVRLPFQEESEGSRRLLSLLPALYRLTGRGGIFVIDELERSMHPMLARKFIEFFLKAARNRQSQLLFATHESTLLDLDLLRRDGIWFAEKSDKGETHLYSLADFKVRKDLRIEKGYLEGRFGAVPFLGGIDHLMEQEIGAEAVP
jgi:uncharacterized protein